MTRSRRLVTALAEHLRKCDHETCEVWFYPARSSRRYCCDACRVAATRQDKAR